MKELNFKVWEFLLKDRVVDVLQLNYDIIFLVDFQLPVKFTAITKDLISNNNYI